MISFDTTDSAIAPYDLAGLFETCSGLDEIKVAGSDNKSLLGCIARKYERLEQRSLPGIYDSHIAELPRLSSDEPLACWLLRAAGIVNNEVIADCLERLSYSSGTAQAQLGIGEILFQTGRLTCSDTRALQAALQMIKNGLLHERFAAVALAMSCKTYIDFEDSLRMLGMHPGESFDKSLLLQLLSDCEVLDMKESELIRSQSLSAGLPVSVLLLRSKRLPATLLKVLLEALVCVGSGRLTYESLVETVKEILRLDRNRALCGISPEAEIVRLLSISSTDRALGNLLLSSELMSREDHISCLEIAVEEHRPLGAVIGERKLLQPALLDTVVRLACRLMTGSLEGRECREILLAAKRNGGKITGNRIGALEFEQYWQSGQKSVSNLVDREKSQLSPSVSISGLLSPSVA